MFDKILYLKQRFFKRRMDTTAIRPNTTTNSFFIHNHYNVVSESFVRRLCGNRKDDSHSPNHSKRVVQTSYEILRADYASKPAIFWSVTVISAWLHDVRDHKFPEENNDEAFISFVNSLKTEQTFNVDCFKYIDLITTYTSFSKENRAIQNGEPLNFKALISDAKFPDADEARDIVSDSDKIDAIGPNGLSRCISTAKTLYAKENNGNYPSESELRALVNNHAKEKLLRLKDEFIKTKTGKILAETAHNEFKKQLDLFNLR